MVETLHALGLISSNNSTERHLPALWLSLQTHQKRALVKNHTGGNFFKAWYAIQRFSKFAAYYVIIYIFMFFYALVSKVTYVDFEGMHFISSCNRWESNPWPWCIMHHIMHHSVMHLRFVCFSQKICINIIMRVDCVHSCAHALTSVLFWRIPLFCVDLLF